MSESRQHYIPRFLLRHFSPEGENYLKTKKSLTPKERTKLKDLLKIYNYDRCYNNICSTNVKSIAYLKGQFSDHTDEIITRNERKTANIIDAILLSQNLKNLAYIDLLKSQFEDLTQRQKNYLCICKFIITQYFRLPQIIPKLQEILKKNGFTYNEKETQDFVDNIISKKPNNTINSDKLYSVINDTFYVYLMNLIDDDMICLLFNESTIPFILSDCVVGENDSLTIKNGDYWYDTDTILNISPKCALAFIIKSSIENNGGSKNFKGIATATESKPVEIHNVNLARNAVRYVFSNNLEYLENIINKINTENGFENNKLCPDEVIKNEFSDC